ncbi:MAG: cytochrome c biogenesis protein ResB [Deltaproteobacteria bacterium]
MKKDNVLWEFFASVKLALFTFIALAVTSIIGTVIPQGEPMSFYIDRFGPITATVFKYMDVPDMYNAWWFLSLLVLFGLNLTVCSLNRIPNVIRILKTDNLDTDPGRFEKLRSSVVLRSALPLAEVVAKVPEVLSKAGWKSRSVNKEGGSLFFSQKGGWTRFGVYAVHTSILVIFVGAIIGSIFGFKASVFIPEGSGTTEIYQRNESHTPIPLGYELFCNRFDLTYYDNGMPKDYTSYLSVIKDGKTLFTKAIEVNDPLQYMGLTFYQSSYQAMDNQFSVFLKDETNNKKSTFEIVPMREIKWPAEKLSFGIVDQRGPDYMGRYRNKIWFSDGQGNPVEFWADNGTPITVKRPSANYSFEIKGRFATGLQVAKDPGVWWVYVGCSVMILGLMVVFFLSHRRLWVWVRADGKGSVIVLSGNANKNKAAFERDLEKLTDAFKEAGDLKIAES